MRSTAITLATALALAALPAGAGAHALMHVDGGVLNYDSPDSVSLNRVVINSPNPDTVEVQDPTVSGGIDPGPCVPVTEYIVDCPSSSVSAVTADLGPHNDRFDIEIPLPVTVYGGPDQDQITGGPLADLIDGGDGFDVLAGGDGNDALTGRAGEDSLDGGAGNDVLIGSEDPDTFQGGPGDDDIRSRDGIAETVSCGDGNDVVTADPSDMAAADCERVDRAVPGTTPPPEEIPPVAAVSGKKKQRITRTKRISLRASSSKAGTITAYTAVSVFNLEYRLTAVRSKVLAGARVTLRPKITKAVMRQITDAWKDREHVSALVRVQATDAFGNRSGTRKLRVRLLR
jgi:hypothetical protein